MKRHYYLLALIFSISNFISAQSSDNKIFHSTGASAFTDYMAGPVTANTILNPLGSIYPTETFYTQFTGLSYFTFIYNIRYNLSEPSPNSAFTASGSPALGLYIATSTGPQSNGANLAGLGSFNLPLLLGYEFGAGATYNSTANMGGFIRFGIEWTKAPMFTTGDLAAGTEIKTSWVEPAIQAGVRYWNRKNKLREINIKYGFGSSAPDKLATYYGTESFASAKTIRLSWLLFLNY
jgi:hypothetical protein